jgi:predicted nucleotidyltransferase
MDDSYIEEKVLNLASEREVIPIAARERGSRMIGVAHKNSDWDVFLLFAQPAEKYATLSEYRDTVSKKYDGGDIDIHGWNVQKLGKLALDSNPNAIEFLMSDKTYFNNLEGYYGRDNILEELEDDARANFNHMALYHHYLSLARSNYEKYISSGNDCTSNRQFYVARATAYATYIRKEGRFPPLDVWEFLNKESCLENDSRFLLEYLSNKKSVGSLGEMEDKVGPMLEGETQADMEPTDERINQPTKELYNDLIRASIK